MCPHGDDFALGSCTAKAEAEGTRVVFCQEDEAEAGVGLFARLIFDDLHVKFFEVGV